MGGAVTLLSMPHAPCCDAGSRSLLSASACDQVVCTQWAFCLMGGAICIELCVCGASHLAWYHTAGRASASLFGHCLGTSGASLSGQVCFSCWSQGSCKLLLCSGVSSSLLRVPSPLSHGVRAHYFTQESSFASVYTQPAPKSATQTSPAAAVEQPSTPSAHRTTQPHTLGSGVSKSWV